MRYMSRERQRRCKRERTHARFPLTTSHECPSLHAKHGCLHRPGAPEQGTFQIHQGGFQGFGAELEPQAYMFPGPITTQHPKLHLDRFSRFCAAHGTDSLYMSVKTPLTRALKTNQSLRLTRLKINRLTALVKIRTFKK